jgi:hypothetical protein
MKTSKAITELDRNLRAILGANLGELRSTTVPGSHGIPGQVAYYWDLARTPSDAERKELAALPIGLLDWEAQGYMKTTANAPAARIEADY